MRSFCRKFSLSSLRNRPTSQELILGSWTILPDKWLMKTLMNRLIWTWTQIKWSITLAAVFHIVLSWGARSSNWTVESQPKLLLFWMQLHLPRKKERMLHLWNKSIFTFLTLWRMKQCTTSGFPDWAHILLFHSFMNPTYLREFLIRPLQPRINNSKNSISSKRKRKKNFRSSTTTEKNLRRKLPKSLRRIIKMNNWKAFKLNSLIFKLESRKKRRRNMSLSNKILLWIKNLMLCVLTIWAKTENFRLLTLSW